MEGEGANVVDLHSTPGQPVWILLHCIANVRAPDISEVCTDRLAGTWRLHNKAGMLMVCAPK